MVAWLDSQLWHLLEETAVFNISRGNRGQEGDLVVNVPIHGLSGKSYQEWVIRLPVKLYGWGFRSLEQICGPAFLGTMVTVIPRMKDICPLLESMWGGEECWGEGSETRGRWRVMLTSGCLEGEEMKHS